MIVFDDSEFEIALATYNRPEYVKEWLSHCYEPALKRNIAISVYDSSTNEDTRNYIELFNESRSVKVNYVRIDSSTIIGYKPMYPILQSSAKFLWVSGDSRYHDFDELDELLFSHIHNDEIDYAALAIVNNRENGGKIYTDRSEMIHDFFVSGTCIGLSVYRLSMFERLKADPSYKAEMDKHFKDNYAFGWLGYFYHVYALKDYKALFVNAKVNEILPGKKVQSWARWFYRCWVDDLLELIDNLPEEYENKNNIPFEVWKVLFLDSVRYCYRARKKGDLDSEKYEELIRNGKLRRVTRKTGKIRLFAKGPVFFLKPVYYVNMFLVSIYDTITRRK